MTESSLRRECLECGVEFIAQHINERLCSGKCRKDRNARWERERQAKRRADRPGWARPRKPNARWMATPRALILRCVVCREFVPPEEWKAHPAKHPNVISRAEYMDKLVSEMERLRRARPGL